MGRTLRNERETASDAAIYVLQKELALTAGPMDAITVSRTATETKQHQSGLYASTTIEAQPVVIPVGVFCSFAFSKFDLGAAAFLRQTGEKNPRPQTRETDKLDSAPCVSLADDTG